MLDASKHGDDLPMAALMAKWAAPPLRPARRALPPAPGHLRVGLDGIFFWGHVRVQHVHHRFRRRVDRRHEQLPQLLSTTTVSYTSATSTLDPTARQAGGLPGATTSAPLAPMA